MCLDLGDCLSFMGVLKSDFKPQPNFDIRYMKPSPCEDEDRILICCLPKHIGDVINTADVTTHLMDIETTSIRAALNVPLLHFLSTTPPSNSIALTSTPTFSKTPLFHTITTTPQNIETTPSNPDDIKLNGPQCGQINQNRISRGNKTFIGQFPFMVLLAYADQSGTQRFKCGGSLITPRYVLTAAHCITEEL